MSVSKWYLHQRRRNKKKYQARSARAQSPTEHNSLITEIDWAKRTHPSKFTTVVVLMSPGGRSVKGIFAVLWNGQVTLGFLYLVKAQEDCVCLLR